MLNPTYTIPPCFKPYIFVFIFIFSSGLYAQKTFTLSGIITDDKGESLIGATVYTQDKSQGVISNEYGFYSLTLEEGLHTLVISFLGFLNHERTINLHSDISLNFGLKTEILHKVIKIEDEYLDNLNSDYLFGVYAIE